MLRRRLTSLTNKLKRNRKPKTKTERKHGNLNFVLLGIIFLMCVLFISLAAPFLKEFMAFQPNNSFETDLAEKDGEQSEYKVLLVGIDRKESNHIFVDGLTLLSVDLVKEDIGMININPDILVTIPGGNKSTTLRRAFIEAENSDIDFLLKLTGNLLASDISHFVIVDKNFLQEMSLYTKTIPVTLFKVVSDPDVIEENSQASWSSGAARIDDCCVYDFLRSDEQGREDQLVRQLKIYQNYTKSIDVLKVILGPKNFFESLALPETNLSKWEMARLAYLMREVPADSYKTVYTRDDILVEQGSAGVYKQYRINEDQLDKDTEIILENGKVVLEQPVVEVLNASGVAGLASKNARWLKNTGMEVIHVANSPFTEENTRVYIENKADYPETEKALRKVLGEQVEILNSGYEYRHIGQIVVVIGKDQI